MSDNSSLPTVEIYTDGSGTVRPHPGGWACVLRYQRPDGSWVERERYGGALDCTSQRMEVMAILMALDSLTRPCNVTIISDSEYCCNSIRQWIEGWERKQWRKVAHADLWQQILEHKRHHHVTSRWTKGHAGTFNNERCDDLAGGARRALKEIVDQLHVDGDLTSAQASVDGLPFPVTGTLVPETEQLALT
jgi:ribonuclease HI